MESYINKLEKEVNIVNADIVEIEAFSQSTEYKNILSCAEQDKVKCRARYMKQRVSVLNMLTNILIEEGEE